MNQPVLERLANELSELDGAIDDLRRLFGVELRHDRTGPPTESNLQRMMTHLNAARRDLQWIVMELEK